MCKPECSASQSGTVSGILHFGRAIRSEPSSKILERQEFDSRDLILRLYARFYATSWKENTYTFYRSDVCTQAHPRLKPTSSAASILCLSYVQTRIRSSSQPLHVIELSDSPVEDVSF